MIRPIAIAIFSDMTGTCKFEISSLVKPSSRYMKEAGINRNCILGLQQPTMQQAGVCHISLPSAWVTQRLMPQTPLCMIHLLIPCDLSENYLKTSYSDRGPGADNSSLINWIGSPVVIARANPPIEMVKSI